MERVLILGATSAIAQRVAHLHAARGDRLHLVGRNPEKLAALQAELASASATSETADFNRLDEAEPLIARCLKALGGLDRVLIAHGELGDQLATEASFAAAEATLRVNLLSVVALLVPLANALERLGQGRLGVITSVAGDRGRPRNYTYGTAKGALNIYLQGLRSRLYAANVTVTTIKLGPVDTPMTRDHAKNALFATAADAAEGIVAAMDAREAEAYVPSVWRAIMPLVKGAPEAVFQRLKFLSGR